MFLYLTHSLFSLQHFLRLRRNPFRGQPEVVQDVGGGAAAAEHVRDAVAQDGGGALLGEELADGGT